MLIEALTPYLPRKNSATASAAQFVTIFLISGNDVNDLLCFFFQHWPNDTIPPKLRFLEEHAADFMER